MSESSYLSSTSAQRGAQRAQRMAQVCAALVAPPIHEMPCHAVPTGMPEWWERQARTHLDRPGAFPAPPGVAVDHGIISK